MLRIIGAALAASLAFATQAIAADAPSEIKIGTLYASSGRYASISMPVYSSLKLWVEQKNAEGGVFVKAFDTGHFVRMLDISIHNGRSLFLQQQVIRTRQGVCVKPIDDNIIVNRVCK